MTESSTGSRGRVEATIRQILLHDWDPIGVQDAPEAQDEYDSYIGGVYHLLGAGASEERLIEYLWQIETVYMGLASVDRAKLIPVARRLCDLDVSP